MTSAGKLSRFTSSLWATTAMVILLAIAFAVYAWSEKKIDRANEQRNLWLLLAEELRQSSNDLTRMARSYVITNDPIYKNNFQTILDIRSGKLPRPQEYHRTYWDLVALDGTPPRPDSQQRIALLDLIRQSGVAEDEFEKLKEAEANSNALTATEFEAMKLAESSGPNAATDHAKARAMMFDSLYHDAKAAIMKPIDEFYVLMDRRTRNKIESAETIATILRVVFSIIGLILVAMLRQTYMNLTSTLGGAVDDIRMQIAKIGSGDFSSPVPCAEEGSILSWLSKTRIKLEEIERQRKTDQERIQDLTNLYAALSRCNQAIVHCNDREELFEQICRAAVQFGKMKMAWIGLLAPDTGMIRPVASAGEGTEYLQDIQISSDADSPLGHGPTGTALREDRPVWCQDFQNSPNTAPWHKHSASHRWGASASLPLHQDGAVVGTFTLYADKSHAFDEAARDLLTEMALDVSYALNRFSSETKRKQMEQALLESEENSRLVMENALDAVINMDEEGLIIGWNNEAAHIFGYSCDEAAGMAVADLIIPPAQREAHRQGIQRLLATRQAHFIGKRIETSAVRRDGSEFPIELSIAQINRGEQLFFSAFLRDITERKRSEAQLMLAAEVFRHSSEGFMITDAERNIIMVNLSFTEITGYSEKEVIGKNPHMLASGHQDEHFYRAMWEEINEDGRWQGELWNRRKDGSLYPEWLSISRVSDANGNVTHFIGIFSDITQLKKSEERIQQLAYFDPLTGLPNRILLTDRINQAIRMAKRNQSPLALLFLDLDHFKNINDSLGHHMGDMLLIRLAERLKDAVRDEDTIARMGGDEFILALTDTSAEGAAHVAEKLLESVARPYQIEQYELIVTPSIGIALYPRDGEDLDSLFKCADAAMYRAKESGRNHYRFFTAEMQSRSVRILQLENALRYAIDNNQLILNYQPQISLQNGRVIGVEALIRWQHPEFGLIAPAEFIPIAEETGQILKIGEWVMRTAMNQLAAWIAGGMEPIIVAVNLSVVQFRHASLSEQVARILEEAKLPAHHLELELTESVAMEDPLAVITIMNDLHAHDIRMSIDDFGTGYSSLSYLKRFRVYKLKIDKSFVQDIDKDADDKAIVSAIISMAKRLGMLTIAEGVETLDQLTFLREQGCDEAQGYYYSKPLPADRIETFVKERNKIGTP